MLRATSTSFFICYVLSTITTYAHLYTFPAGAASMILYIVVEKYDNNNCIYEKHKYYSTKKSFRKRKFTHPECYVIVISLKGYC